MWYLKEKVIKEKQRLHSPEGFVSVYFLAIMLTISVFTAAAALNEKAYFEVIINMEINMQYQQAETQVLSYLKCALMTNTLTDAEYETADVICTIEVYEDAVYVFVSEPVQETLTVTFDSETMKIIDFSCDR